MYLVLSEETMLLYSNNKVAFYLILGPWSHALGSCQLFRTRDVCRAQFSVALRRAIDLAAKIDKDGPDRPTDMQVLTTTKDSLLLLMPLCPEVAKCLSDIGI
jgi:hypothetical protein